MKLPSKESIVMTIAHHAHRPSLVAVLVAMLAVLGLIAGCSADAPDPADDDDTQLTPEESTEESADALHFNNCACLNPGQITKHVSRGVCYNAVHVGYFTPAGCHTRCANWVWRRGAC